MDIVYECFDHDIDQEAPLILQQNTPGLARAPQNVSQWKFDDYKPKVFAEHGTNLRLLPHLLRTVTYTFDTVHAQVVPVVLHRSTKDSCNLRYDIAHLQHVLLGVFAEPYRSDISADARMHILEMPLKRTRFGTPTDGACKGFHRAQVLAIADVQQLSKLKWLSYSYIGRRAWHDAPFCTSLVSQRMPLDLADRFYALLLFLANGSVREDFLWSSCRKTLQNLKVWKSYANSMLIKEHAA